MPENPFEVLRLDPTASEEEVVRQAGRLRRLSRGEAALNAVRQAVQELTRSAEGRALHAVLTHPRPCYRWPALERLAAEHRRPPRAAGSEAVPPPDITEFADLLLRILAEELDLAPQPFEPPEGGDTPEEVARQTAEALWQGLLYDPGT
jgi:hypothetical protein